MVRAVAPWDAGEHQHQMLANVELLASITVSSARLFAETQARISSSFINGSHTGDMVSALRVDLLDPLE